MTMQKLAAFPDECKALIGVRRGRWRVGVQNRARIVNVLHRYWSEGRSPVPKMISFDVGIGVSQVVRHLRFLEQRGFLVRRREPVPRGVLLFVDRPGS